MPKFLDWWPLSTTMCIQVIHNCFSWYILSNFGAPSFQVDMCMLYLWAWHVIYIQNDIHILLTEISFQINRNNVFNDYTLIYKYFSKKVVLLHKGNHINKIWRQWSYKFSCYHIKCSYVNTVNGNFMKSQAA